MPPQNSSASPQGQDPYGFIMNNQQGPSRSRLALSSTKARILVVVGGIILLIIIVVIFSTILGSGAKAQKQRYVEIAQKQTELIRISTIADKKAKGLATRSYALTTRMGLESSQKKTSDILAKRGVKAKELAKVLPAGKNDKSDAALDEAEKNNRFDETFLQLMESELTNYQKLLEAASGSASKSEKQALQQAYDQVAILKAKPEKTPRPVNAAPAAEEEPATGEEFTEDEFAL